MEPRIAFYVRVRKVYTKTDRFQPQSRPALSWPSPGVRSLSPGPPMVRSFFLKNILIKIAKKRCITFIATV